MVKIFKRLLFLAILGIIGFGIYMGISKLVDIIQAPKSTPIITQEVKKETQLSGTIQKTGSIAKISTGNKTNTTGQTLIKTGSLVVTTGSNDTQAGFFQNIWTTIKGWFTFEDSTPKVTLSTGDKISSGNQMTGLISSGVVHTGNELDEFIKDTSTGTTVNQTTKNTTVSTKTPETTTKTTVTKKPSTTTTSTTTKTSNSNKDPILDALF